MEGYIKLHRQILESSIFASQIGFKIWIWCLLKANFKDKYASVKIGKGESQVYIKRGSFIFGRFKAEDELNIDGSTIYKWIKKLEEENMLFVKSNSHYSVVTICKYDEYQQQDNDEVATIQQPFNSQVATIQQQSNTTKNDKNDKNDDNEKPIIDKPFNFLKSLIDLGVQKKIAKDWMLVRKNKSAANTETAFNAIAKEITISGLTANECIEIAVVRSWQGFKAEWIKDKNKFQTHQEQQNIIPFTLNGLKDEDYNPR